MKKNNFWFTLIELIVSITIISIIIWSVFTIFAMQADLNNKVDISRSMQENIKNIVSTIGEDIRVSSFSWVNLDLLTTNCSINDTLTFNSWTKLCLDSGINYYLGTYNSSNDIVRVDDYNICNNWKDECFFVKEINSQKNELSNSWVQFTDLKFILSTTKPQKVIINFSLKPSSKKWIKRDLIENTKINFQTTFTKRLYE